MKTSAFCCALILSAGNMLHRKLNRFETGLPHARFCFEIRCL